MILLVSDWRWGDAVSGKLRSFPERCLLRYHWQSEMKGLVFFGGWAGNIWTYRRIHHKQFWKFLRNPFHQKSGKTTKVGVSDKNPQVEDDDHQLSVQHKNLPSKDEVNSAKARMLGRDVSWNRRFIQRKCGMLWTYLDEHIVTFYVLKHPWRHLCLLLCQDINTLVDALIDEESTLLTRRRHREGLIQLLSRLYEVDVTAEARPVKCCENWKRILEILRDSKRLCWFLGLVGSKASGLQKLAFDVSHSLRSILKEDFLVGSFFCSSYWNGPNWKAPGQTSPAPLQVNFTQPPFSVVLIFLFCWKSHQTVSYEIIRIIQLDHGRALWALPNFCAKSRRMKKRRKNLWMKLRMACRVLLWCWRASPGHTRHTPSLKWGELKWETVHFYGTIIWNK